MSLICDIRHPSYTSESDEWFKWRTVYEGGSKFIEQYLKKFSTRESNADFDIRKALTPIPAIATSAIKEIIGSISQRLSDVARSGGSKTYQDAIEGKGQGIDLHNNSMNSFLSTEVLEDLLVVKRVGVYVDMPQNPGLTIMDSRDSRPYLYVYKAEDILSWSYRRDQPDEYRTLLLRDTYEITDSNTGLPSDVDTRYRLYFIDENDGKVHVQFFKYTVDNTSIPINAAVKRQDQVDYNGDPTDKDMILEITRIPFHVFKISQSLMQNVVNHQIALLNLESADVSYALKSNFPFYTEQRDTRDGSHLTGGPAFPGADGSRASTENKTHEVAVGVSQGREYGLGMERPGFIHPSSEPLKVSMDKQAQLKRDIREIVNLSLANVRPTGQSAEAKSIDVQSLEAGLTSIGIVLELGERKLASYWAAYEGSAVATVKYPGKYSLKTGEERRAEADSLKNLRSIIPSVSFQRSISKEIATALLGPTISSDLLDKIHKEVDSAPALTSDPDTIFGLVDRGVFDLVTVAKIFGATPDVVKKAAADHADRLKRIQEAQAPKNDGESGDPAARGIKDLSGDPGNGAAKEKADAKDTTGKQTGEDPTRGKGIDPQM